MEWRTAGGRRRGRPADETSDEQTPETAAGQAPDAGYEPYARDESPAPPPADLWAGTATYPPVEPARFEPAPVEPAPVETARFEPAPFEPASSEPASSDRSEDVTYGRRRAGRRRAAQQAPDTAQQHPALEPPHQPAEPPFDAGHHTDNHPDHHPGNQPHHHPDHHPDHQAGHRIELPTPSVTEIGVYGVLASVLGAVILVAGGYAIWQGLLVVIGTIALVALLAYVAPRVHRANDSGPRRRRRR